MNRTPRYSFPSSRVPASAVTMEADDRAWRSTSVTHYTIAARLLRSRAKRALASLRSKLRGWPAGRVRAANLDSLQVLFAAAHINPLLASRT